MKQLEQNRHFQLCIVYVIIACTKTSFRYKLVPRLAEETSLPKRLLWISTVTGVSDYFLDLCLLHIFLSRSLRNSRINRRKQQRWRFPLLPGKVHGHSSDVAWSDTDLYRMVLRIYDHPISHHNTRISQCTFQTTWSLSVLHLCFPWGWGGGKVISCGIVLYQTRMGRKS